MVDASNIVPLPVPDRRAPAPALWPGRKGWARQARQGLATAAARVRQRVGLYLIELLTGLSHRARRREAAASDLTFRAAVTVDCAPRVAYAFWRDVANLPRVLRHVACVEDLGGGRTRWTARTRPGQRRLSWEAELVEDRPGRCLAWRSVPDAPLHHAGRLTFEPVPPRGAGRGRRACRVTLELNLGPSRAGALVALGLLHATVRPLVGRELEEELRRFKQLVEVVTPMGAPSGRRRPSPRSDRH